MNLPDDYRKGIYTDGSILATVDTRWSKDEIMMHDETNDVSFTLTPTELSRMQRIATKKCDGLDYERLKGKTVEDLGGIGYGI